MLQCLHLCLGKALQSCIRHIFIFGILKIQRAFHIIHKLKFRIYHYRIHAGEIRGADQQIQIRTERKIFGSKNFIQFGKTLRIFNSVQIGLNLGESRLAQCFQIGCLLIEDGQLLQFRLLIAAVLGIGQIAGCHILREVGFYLVHFLHHRNILLTLMLCDHIIVIMQIQIVLRFRLLRRQIPGHDAVDPGRTIEFCLSAFRRPALR